MATGQRKERERGVRVVAQLKRESTSKRKTCTHRRQSLTVWAVSRQVRSKVRGLLCSVSEGQTRLII